LLVVAGHFGGSLTHGSDYFVRYAPGPFRSWLGGPPQASPIQTNHVEIAQLPVFAGVVRPVLQQDCVPCHGPEKSKGRLRLDTLEGLAKGGKSGPAIVAGKSADSEVIKRMLLPLTDDDHMPPNGKPQPSADDLALLQWWLDSGASSDKQVSELKSSPRVTQILAAKFGSPAPIVKTVPPKPLKDVLPQSAALAAELSIAITPLSPQEPWLQCNASIAGTNFGDAELKKLAALGANLRWLDVAGTAISDTGLAQFETMPNLTRLHLERTHLTDASLAQVASLNNLEYLNLYGTEISDAGLDHLQNLPKLRQLYLWQTKVTPAAGKAFAEARTDQDQLQRWREEIEQLNTKIREAHISVDLGTILPAAASTNTTPVNAVCPVSGKPIDPTKTLLHNGVLVAFCCDDCKAKFQQDPAPYLAKLEPKKEPQPATK
jgi:YHS domain-containing protein